MATRGLHSQQTTAVCKLEIRSVERGICPIKNKNSLFVGPARIYIYKLQNLNPRSRLTTEL